MPISIKFEEKLPTGGMGISHASLPSFLLTYEALFSLPFFPIHSGSKEVNQCTEKKREREGRKRKKPTTLVFQGGYEI